MCEFMSLQMPFRNESLLTKLTLEGPITRVSPHVGLQIARLRELLQAVLEWTQEQFYLVFWSFYALDY
jgi:hypothetical protein